MNKPKMTKEQWREWGNIASLRLMLDQFGCPISKKEKKQIAQLSVCWAEALKDEIEANDTK